MASDKGGLNVPLVLLILFVAATAVVVVRKGGGGVALKAFSPGGAPITETFTAGFPGIPNKFVTRRPHPDGDFVSTEYQTRTKTEVLTVSVLPYPAPAMERAHKDPEKVLAGLKDWISTKNLENPWVVSSEETFTTPQGYPGLEIRFTQPDPSGGQEKSGVGRFVIGKASVFHYGAFGPDGPDAAVIQEFMSSFELPDVDAKGAGKPPVVPTNPGPEEAPPEDATPEAPEAPESE